MVRWVWAALGAFAVLYAIAMGCEGWVIAINVVLNISVIAKTIRSKR